MGVHGDTNHFEYTVFIRFSADGNNMHPQAISMRSN